MEETRERRVVIIPADPNMAHGEAQSFQQKRVAAYCRVSTDEDEQLISQSGFQAYTWDDTLVRKLFACIKVTPQNTIKLYYRDSKVVVEEPLTPLPKE